MSLEQQPDQISEVPVSRNKSWLKIGTLVVLIAVLAAGGYLAWRSRHIKTETKTTVKQPSPQDNFDAHKPAFTLLSKDEVPKDFPAGLPLEKNATTTQNFKVNNQATQIYISKQSVDENFADYKQYFEQNGWTIISTENKPGFKSIFAQKDKMSINVGISQDTKTKEVTVNLTTFTAVK